MQEDIQIFVDIGFKVTEIKMLRKHIRWIINE